MEFVELKKRLQNVSENDIKDDFRNLITDENLNKLIELHRDLSSIISLMEIRPHPGWLIQATTHFIGAFMNVYIRRGDAEAISKVWHDSYYQRVNNKSSNYYYPTIPVIQSWLNSAEKFSMHDSKLEEYINTSVNESIQLSLQEFEVLRSETDKINEQSTAILSKLHEASVKIAVKEYAGIFQQQADNHSSKISFELNDEETKWGDAQKWLTFGIILSVIFMFLMLKIDALLSIGKTWTPDTIAHLLGRALIISLFIFLISFCFRQYRINKHLFTLNQHRANTLKSFEYLTNAIDNNDRSSYNAVLMKVAESIYEAGNTGYVNANDKNSDGPTIIDMAKVVTGGGKP